VSKRDRKQRQSPTSRNNSGPHLSVLSENQKKNKGEGEKEWVKAINYPSEKGSSIRRLEAGAESWGNHRPLKTRLLANE